jgi:uncharacterized membrane protein YkgB
MRNAKIAMNINTGMPQPRSRLSKDRMSGVFQRIGFAFLRYGLVVAIGWIAAMKGTAYEANGIHPLIANSPFLRWGYNVWTVRQFTAGIGGVELAIVTLIALRHWFPKACVVGSAGAVLMFLVTLSFLISTPGWEPSLGGFPALSGDVGEFLIKDLVLLGAAFWSLGEALGATGQPRTNPLHRVEEVGIIRDGQ